MLMKVSALVSVATVENSTAHQVATASSGAGKEEALARYWPREAEWLYLIALGLGRLSATFLSQVMVAHFSQRAIADMRRGLVRKILSVPLRDFESIGGPRFMVTLTEDVMEVGAALLMIPLSAMNLALLFGGAIYLSWVSWKVAASISAIIIVGGIIYRWFIGTGFRHLVLAREQSDKLYGHFRAVTEGVKELKLRRSRRGKFLSEDIQSVTENFSRHTITAEVRFVMGQAWSQLIFFSLIGLLLFVVASVGKIRLGPVMWEVLPFLAWSLIVLALTIVFPPLTTWLPGQIK